MNIKNKNLFRWSSDSDVFYSEFKNKSISNKFRSFVFLNKSFLSFYNKKNKTSTPNNFNISALFFLFFTNLLLFFTVTILFFIFYFSFKNSILIFINDEYYSSFHKVSEKCLNNCFNNFVENNLFNSKKSILEYIKFSYSVLFNIK